MDAGVYAITNTVTEEQYIGATRDLKRRLVSHRAALRSARHPNKRLQESWSQYGEEVFSFSVLDELKDCNALFLQSRLLELEGIWMNRLKPAFNIRITLIGIRTHHTINNMTNWTDERLDRLAEAVETNTRDIAELRRTADTILQIAEIHQRDIEALGRDTIGLQREVRRLVEELRQGKDNP